MSASEAPQRALDTRSAARYVGLAPRTLANMRCPSSSTEGPTYRLLGSKPVYDVAELDRWLDAQPVRSRNPTREPA